VSVTEYGGKGLKVSGQLHAPAALPPGKSPWYPFYRRLGGPWSWSGRYGEVKIFYPTQQVGRTSYNFSILHKYDWAEMIIGNKWMKIWEM
jgi:hypothetical protein